VTHTEVLTAAHHLRVKRGDPHIAELHLADAIEQLTREQRESLSKNRAPKDPYAKPAAAARKAKRAKEKAV
jgi:hypothetical protein